jgi:hypothetical protein
MARIHDLPRLTHGAILWREVVARHSVTSASARRLNGGDGVQIEIDHVLKRRRGGAVAQLKRPFQPPLLRLPQTQADLGTARRLRRYFDPIPLRQLFGCEGWTKTLILATKMLRQRSVERGGRLRFEP